MADETLIERIKSMSPDKSQSKPTNNRQEEESEEEEEEDEMEDLSQIVQKAAGKNV